jgi:hypothetical protein
MTRLRTRHACPHGYLHILFKTCLTVCVLLQKRRELYSVICENKDLCFACSSNQSWRWPQWQFVRPPSRFTEWEPTQHKAFHRLQRSSTDPLPDCTSFCLLWRLTRNRTSRQVCGTGTTGCSKNLSLPWTNILIQNPATAHEPVSVPPTSRYQLTALTSILMLSLHFLFLSSCFKEVSTPKLCFPHMSSAWQKIHRLPRNNATCINQLLVI